jgi:putative transposase
MPKKRHNPEEIVAKLRQVDVLTSQGTTVADAIRQIVSARSPGDRTRD